MVFTVLTPIPASTNSFPTVVISNDHNHDSSDMSTHPSSPSNRLRLHASPNAASKAARDSIMSSSAKGWSPLQINKREGGSPNPSSNPTSPNLSAPSDGPRRTSNSFKHVNRNSLVTNSPFKNASTVQGAQAAGLEGSTSSRQEAIHERRAPGQARALGQQLPSAAGAAATPKAAIGLGIGIGGKPRARTPSGSAVAGQRRVSNERKVVIPSTERRTSGSKATATKENESPDARTSKPRQSGALSGLKAHSYVTRSPFLSNGDATPSPKTVSAGDIPISSPSPRRVSGGRKVSPASRSIRTSPTPSPPRLFSHSTSLGAGPSPLRGATLGAPRLPDERSPSPSPMPGKSAMTPSRRLLGPRDHSVLDSPSKQSKTVTFQSVPDVKEFDRMSIEASLDESFDMRSPDSDWVDELLEDEELGENSLDDIMASADLDQAMGGMTISSFGGDVESSPEMDDEGGESTTANFLMEQGIFTPEPSSAPVMPEQDIPDVPEIPSTSSTSAPYLSTPSLGGSVSLDPSFPDNDNAGIPYGRTHHAERNAMAHSLPPLETVSPLEHPDLPSNTEHQMLLNANAAQPSLDLPTMTSQSSGPHAHQSGPMFDPFITSQTVTSVVSPPEHRARAEDGIPLGRTSHAERVYAARQLATQTIGLGMPRSPARVSAPSASARGREDRADVDSESGSEVDSGSGSEDDERFFASPGKVNRVEETGVAQEQANETKRVLPHPPRPIDVPPPVIVEPEIRKSTFEMSLPAINAMSPFFQQTPAFEPQPRIPSNDPSEPSTLPSDDDRPLTPPPMRQSPKDESPHRIPSLEFEEIRFTHEVPEMKRAEVRVNTVSPTKTRFGPGETAPITTSNAPATQQPPPPQARQRISRDKVREAMDRKYADGSLTRRPTSIAIPPSSSTSSTEEKRSSVLGGYTTSIQPPSLSAISPLATSPRPRPASTLGTVNLGVSGVGGGARNKALPTPPESSPMLKSATEIPASSASATRPQPRPRANTQAAEQIQLSSSTGGEPRSALDKIISGVIPAGIMSRMGDKADRADRAVYELKAAPVQPVSILQKSTASTGPSEASASNSTSTSTSQPLPKRASSMAPPVVPLPSVSKAQVPDPVPVVGAGAGAMQSLPLPNANANANTRPVSAIEGVRHQKQRNVSGISLVSTGSRKSRRSMSMSDAAVEIPVQSRKPRLTLGLGEEKASMADSFKEELESINGDRAYKVRERHVKPTSYVSTVSHPKAGDIERGKAWRQLRRPSDINEHAAELRAMKEADGKDATGTIFVKVLGIESLGIPLPAEPTDFQVTLDNGIDYIRTPFMRLMDGARVNQEFALVEQPNFSFSLSLEIRRDPHIIRALREQEQYMQQSQQPQRNNGASSNPTSRQSSLALPLGHTKTASGGGIKSLFTSPRKAKSTAPPSPMSSPSPSILSRAPPPPLRESIVSYLPSPNSSTIGKTHISFKPIAKQCEAKVLEIRYPMFAMFKGEPERRGETAPPNTNASMARKQVAKITLQIFRLPPLPGLKTDDLPQCIDECLRGMRHHAWHECEYHEGVLTQEGGDCNYPRRRMFKLVGGRMIASSEVTGKEWATIDLRHAMVVVDLNPDTTKLSPASKMSRVTRAMMDEEGFVTARPNSFRVEFRDGEMIVFSADTADAKRSWMDALEGLLGKIPSNPLWAEMLATKMREQKERQQMRSASRSTMTSSNGHSGYSGYSGHSGHSAGANGARKGGREVSGAQNGLGRSKSRETRASRESRDLNGAAHGQGQAQMRREKSLGQGDDALSGRRGEGVV